MEKFIRKEDGYVNATKLCKEGAKEFKHWNSLLNTKKLICIVSKYTNIDSDKLMDIKKGGDNTSRGSWVHPLLGTNIAQWISIDFAIKVSLWIEEWKKINNNTDIYNHEIINLKPDFNDLKEKQIQIRLQKELGGEIEVLTDSGYIDLLTDTEIIEIKSGKNWKEAVGQVLMYSLDFPSHKKRIYLFDMKKDKKIESKCQIYNIHVSYET